MLVHGFNVRGRDILPDLIVFSLGVKFAAQLKTKGLYSFVESLK